MLGTRYAVQATPIDSARSKTDSDATREAPADDRGRLVHPSIGLRGRIISGRTIANQSAKLGDLRIEQRWDEESQRYVRMAKLLPADAGATSPSRPNCSRAPESCW